MLLGGTVNFIRSVSPAFRTTEVVVTEQLLATVDGAVADPQDTVPSTIGNNSATDCRRRGRLGAMAAR
jgi:hypothetical protein